MSKAARFFRTPKGLALIAVGVVLVAGAAGTGVALVLPGVVASVIAAVIVDAPILRVREGRWVVPDGAILTGLFVAMILSPHQHWYIAAITSAVGVGSKYAFRVRSANVFNPAAFALVATFYVFHTGQSWWGALAELPAAALVVLFAAGIFITDRVNKTPAVLAFLGSYYAIITTAAFIIDPANVAELYRAPDVHAALFYAFFMITDPPTSPPKARDQVEFGIIAGVASCIAFAVVGAAYFLLAGLLIANVWEARRRQRAAAERTRVRDVAAAPASSTSAASRATSP